MDDIPFSFLLFENDQASMRANKNFFLCIPLDICIYRQLMTATLSRWLMIFSHRPLFYMRKKLRYISDIFVELIKHYIAFFRASNYFSSNLCYFILYFIGF